MSYLPYDSGGELEPCGAADASGNSAPPSVPQAEELSLPPIDKLAELLRALVERHGRHAFMKELLRVMSKEQIMETTERVCNAQWGEEPLLQSGTGAVRCGSCSAPQRAVRQLFPLTCLTRSWTGTVGERSLASALHDIVGRYCAARVHAVTQAG